VKQQINLYLPEFRQKKDPLNTQNMILVIGLLVAGLALYTAGVLWEGFQLNSDLADRQQQRDALIAETEQLVTEFGSQSEDPALTKRAMALEEDLANKQLLKRFLDGRNIGSTAGFSEYLADLARYHLGGLRLTEIQLLDGGKQVRLEGEVLSPQLVPEYFQSLRQGKSFAGKEFESLKITESTTEGEALPVKLFTAATSDQD